MRIFLLFLALLSFGFSACTPKNNNNGSLGEGREASGVIRVTATIFPPYDFVREIAGDKVRLAMLLPVGGESHSYEPTPQDIIAIQNSDVFVYGGGESDAWVERILASIGATADKVSDTANAADSVSAAAGGRLRIVSMMNAVDAVEEEVVEGMEAEGDSLPADGADDEGPEYDEHVWTSPKNAKLIVKVISEALVGADPRNAAFYRQNTDAYLAKLDALDAAFTGVVDHAARKTIVFGDRFPLRYFADAYGLSYYAAFPGCSTETEPSAATVAFLIDKMRAEKIPVIFHIELSNERMADAIAEATGAKKLLFHSGHNISKRDFDKGVTFLELQQANVERLKEALQ